MAIYSLNLASIGRTTHAAGTAGAHIRYIGRDEAQPVLMAGHMPEAPKEARRYLDQEEAADRKNARVIDKLRLALPRELDDEQRVQLVRDFAAEITKGRVPWYAAIHQTGKDVHNPHCHLVIRDRDIETGKRVARLSDSARDRQKAGLEPKAVDWVRERWEHLANNALERAGHDARIDRRTLEAQGIEREPTIHIGPQAQHIDRTIHRPRSKIVETGNGRSIDYEMIDAGRTRRERHAEIVDFNLEKDARSKDFATRERAKFLKDQIAKDRALESRLIVEARRRTLEHRRIRAARTSELKEYGDHIRSEMQDAKRHLREEWERKRQALKAHHDFERASLAKKQGGLVPTFMRVMDITGRTRAAQNAAREVLSASHAEERSKMLQEHRSVRDGLLSAIRGEYDAVNHEITERHACAARDIQERHNTEEAQADELRQDRAREREQQEQRLETALRQLERMRKQREQDKDKDKGLER